MRRLNGLSWVFIAAALCVLLTVVLPYLRAIAIGLVAVLAQHRSHAVPCGVQLPQSCVVSRNHLKRWLDAMLAIPANELFDALLVSRT
jgi:hypothetical protein